MPILDEFAEATEVLRAAEALCGISAAEMAVLPRTEQLRHYESAIVAWMQGRVRLSERPSAAQFHTGIARWLADLVERPARGQRVLAITSAGVIAAVIAEVLALPTERMAQFTRVLRNASLTEIAFSPGRASLVSFNSVTHLPPELASAI